MVLVYNFIINQYIFNPIIKNRDLKKGDFPKSEDYAESCFSIPLYPELNNFDLKEFVRY